MASRIPPELDRAIDTPPRGRRWIPVSVRLLVLLFPLIGIAGFTWIAVRGYSNAVIIHEIERRGGEVRTRPRAPEWLQQRVSGEWATLLDDVDTVRFYQASDDWLLRLTGLTNLETLWLDGSPITDAGLLHLKHCKNLRHLGLDHTGVTDAGIAQLSSMTHLEGLSLAGTKVTDVGLTHLSGLDHLRWLNLESTSVTDDGLARLEGLPKLETLQLAYWPSEPDDRFAALRRARPELRIENGLLIHRTFWPPSQHSPLFFASGTLLLIVAVVVWLLALVYLLPLAVIKLSGWYTSRRGPSAATGPPRRPPGVFSVGAARGLWFSRGAGGLIIMAIAFLIAMPIIKQQVAVHAIEQLGGSFETRIRYPEGQADSAVSGLLPLDRLISVHVLSFYRVSAAANVTDADLARLKRFPTLQVLRLDNAPITDTGLADIRGLADLRELDLKNSRVTDAGLPVLKSFRRLKNLDLSDTRITDKGLVHLADLASLDDLRLSNTAITDAGMTHLSRLTALTWLDLEGTGVTDSGLSHLAKLTELQYLRLAHMPQVTGRGIVHLQALKNLETLSLDGQQFAQAGVHSLQQLKSLRSLSLVRTKMSDAELADLECLLPKVFVHLDHPVDLEK